MSNKCYLILLYITISSCSLEKNNKQGVVINQLFGTIVENYTQDVRTMYWPSPEDISSGKFKGKTKKRELKKTDKKFMLIIQDSMYGFLKIDNFKSYTSKDLQDRNIFNTKNYSFNFNKYNYDKVTYELIQNQDFINNEAFYREHYYYGGHITISNISFNNDFSERIIFISYNCGKLCSASWKVHIVKSDKKWKIKDSETLTIS